MYDIVIIGGGPAGLTAAIYALRASRTVLVIEKATYGGQMNFSPKIENYPSMNEISGMELADKMATQAMALGGDYELDEIKSVTKTENGFLLEGDFGSYEGRTVIIATGAAHRRLGVAGEDEFIGNGISFCAICDGAFYKDKEVVVVGGGNSALQEAVLLSGLCRKVTIVQNLPDFTGEKTLADKLLATENVEVIFDTLVTGFYGSGVLEGAELSDGRKLACDGAFVAVGLAPATKPFGNIVGLDEYGYVVAGENCTPEGTPGIFVAGDCRTKSVKQIATAIADGAVAALEANSYLGKLQ